MGVERLADYKAKVEKVIATYVALTEDGEVSPLDAMDLVADQLQADSMIGQEQPQMAPPQMGPDLTNY